MSSNLLMGDFVYIRLVEMQKNHYSKILAERVTESEYPPTIYVLNEQDVLKLEKYWNKEFNFMVTKVT